MTKMDVVGAEITTYPISGINRETKKRSQKFLNYIDIHKKIPYNESI